MIATPTIVSTKPVICPCAVSADDKYFFSIGIDNKLIIQVDKKC